ncbi:PD-(D/E)XK nuclease family protein [Peptoniphilus sp. AGMB00490]|uniref:PD-(D/E)XK nuclease family protein n=1 Tax=Peptoniphilus faecalis TaxID=2731255 RepID=A0A848RGW9_9FIRM|nr:PD-(D/E)XK nuclease family protein [Peptoniphilus faecalis]NMW86070.1 PD-(D/E)XK nuclease family protein [Peptoniphilus faecalis]
MKKIIFRNPREKFDFANLKGKKTLIILPSQSAINFYIRDMLENKVDITKTEFDTFDGIGKKIRRYKPDSILKYIILSKILKDNFGDRLIFPETVDIILDFFDDIVENNLCSEDILTIDGEIFKNLGKVFRIYKDYFEKRGYDIYGRIKDQSMEGTLFDTFIISGFLEFRKSEEEIIKKLSKISNKNIYIDIPFNFFKSELVSSTIKSLKDLDFILEEKTFLDYKEYLKAKEIYAISSKGDFYNLFFSKIKMTLKNKKVEDIGVLTGSRGLAYKIKSRENFENLEFNVKCSERSLLESEFMTLLEYFKDKSRENTIKRVRLSYFPLECDLIDLEKAFLSYDFKNLYDIDFSKVKSITVNSNSIDNFLRGVEILQDEVIKETANIDYYLNFFGEYLDCIKIKIADEVETNPETFAIRDLRFLEKMKESFSKMKKLSSLYSEISLFDFVLITKKYIEKSKTDAIQNLEGIEISNYSSNYYREFKNLFLIGFDQNFERNVKNNFLYNRESEEDMREIGLIKDNFTRDYIYLIYDLIMSEEVFILIDDYDKGLSKLLNKLIFDLGLKIQEHEKIYSTSNIDFNNSREELNYNVSREELAGINKKIRERNYYVTDFDTLKECPRRFLFEKVYKIEKLEKDYDEKYYQRTGDKYHHILEKYFKRERDLKIETLKELILEEENLGDFNNLSFLEKISVINSFNTLSEYIKSDLEEQKKYGFMPKYFEEKIDTDISGIKIKGRIDRIDSLGESEILIDYKRSNIRTKKEIEDLKSFQMPIYAISRIKVGKKIASAIYGSVKKAELTTVIKNSDILPRDDKRRNYFTEDELCELLKKVEAEIIAMTNSITSGDYNSRSDCKNCDYTEICENKEI